MLLRHTMVLSMSRKSKNTPSEDGLVTYNVRQHIFLHQRPRREQTLWMLEPACPAKLPERKPRRRRLPTRIHLLVAFLVLRRPIVEGA